MEIDRSHSKISSSHSKSKTKTKSKTIDNNNVSDDISMAELELLANKKKLNKKSDDISLDIENKDNIKVNEQKSIKPSIKSSLSSSSSKRLSSDSKSEERYKQDKRKVNKENKNETIRKEKSEILFKLHQVVDRSNGRWTTTMSMDNTLNEIKSEFIRIKSTLDNEGMVKFCKHGLVMGIKGMEMLNNNYDPLGVDLDGWSEAMSYNMQTTEYDEVLSELCEKYKGTGSMSPEVKLLVMIVMSGAMFSFSKKAAKDPTTLTNLMGSFMSKQKSKIPDEKQPESQSDLEKIKLQQAQMQAQMQAQQQQTQIQAQIQAQMQAQQQAQMQAAQPYNFYPQQPQHQALDIESSDSDKIPSKLRGPQFDTPDSLDIENIIKTMKEKTKEKEQNKKQQKNNINIEDILNKTDSDDVVRDIPAPKKKGRPKKTKMQTIKKI